MKKRTALFILSLVLAFSAAAPAYASLTTTSAPTAATWYADAAKEYGYQDVFGDVFEPQRAVTRMEFARLLLKVFDLNPKKDGSTQHDTESVLSALTAAGIDAKNVSMGSPIGRAEMAHWVVKTLDYITGGQYAMIMIMPAPFEDDALIPDSFRQSIIKAVVLKLVNGRGNNVFAPMESATCAEAVVIVSRLKSLADSLIPNVSVTANVKVENGALVMSLAMKNNTKETVTIEHSNMQRYDFELYDASEKLLYSWSLGRMFGLVLGTTEILPGNTVTYTETISAEELAAIKGDIAYMKAYIVGTSESFPIVEDGYYAYLNY